MGIKVRKVSNVSRGEAYGFSWLVIIPARVTGGKRIRRQFGAPEGRKAVQFGEDAAAKAITLGQSGFRLTLEQYAEAKQALELLHPLGLSILDAARYASKHLRPAGGDITVGRLRERILDEKRGENLRRASLQGLSYHLKILVKHFGAETQVKSVNYDQLRRWLTTIAEAGASKRHVRNFVRYARQFFKYAADHSFVAENPAKNLKAPRLDEKTPVILTVPDVKRLLAETMKTDHRDLLPAVVLGLFCGGMRTEELAKLRWDHIDLAAGRITVSAEVSKTRDIRYPEIPPVAAEYLKLCPARSGPVAPRRFRHRLTALHKAAGFPNWKTTHANAKRHSFGSYASKLHDAEWVVGQMGNSVRILLRHYRDANVTAEQARAFFDIRPEGH